jgi:radical SAM family uncharacterized protein
MEILSEILNKVEKPAVYIGGEYNSILKDHSKIEVKFALVFPDLYEIGMSHLGLQILYYLLNSKDYILAERVFSPRIDMESFLRKYKIPLFTLESKTPLKNFDVLGFSLMYEMCYTNVLNIISLAQLPLKAEEREETFPLIIAGGTCCYNPEPLKKFFDLFVIGEGEEVIIEIAELIRISKREKISKFELLKELSKIEGVFVPFFKTKEKIKKRIVYDLENSFYPTKQIVPYVEIVQDRINLEIFRGCVGGCRFCQAGIIYRPKRIRSPEKIITLIKEILKNTGYEEVSLLSLSTSDYPELENLCKELLKIFKPKGISLSLPSLRPASFTFELAKIINSLKKTGVTFVPEAGTERMRKIINKNIKEESLLKAVTYISKLGWLSFKLYFMIGLPRESKEDLLGIVKLIKELLKTIDSIPANKIRKINVSISSFIPKPHTPFQWERENSIEEIKEKQKEIFIKDKRVSLKFHSPELSFLEGVFSRGDEKLNSVLLQAHKLGCKFDSWSDFFNFKLWMEAFYKVGIEPKEYLKEKNLEEALPWDYIDCGVSKKFLQMEREKSYNV